MEELKATLRETERIHANLPARRSLPSNFIARNSARSQMPVGPMLSLPPGSPQTPSLASNEMYKAHFKNLTHEAKLQFCRAAGGLVDDPPPPLAGNEMLRSDFKNLTAKMKSALCLAGGVIVVDDPIVPEPVATVDPEKIAAVRALVGTPVPLNRTEFYELTPRERMAFVYAGGQVTN